MPFKLFVFRNCSRYPAARKTAACIISRFSDKLKAITNEKMKRGKNMTYEKIFSEVQKNFKKAKISNFTREFAFQFNITGDGEGIFYAAYKNGVLSVEPYDYQDRDVIFTADGKTITDIASGKLEPIDAINGGKLFVDGNQDIAKEIMLLINHRKKAADKPEAKTTATKAAASPKKAAEKKTPAKAKAEAKPSSAAKSEAKPAAKSTKPAVKTEAKTEAKTEKKAAEKSTATAAPKTRKTAGKTSKK